MARVVVRRRRVARARRRRRADRSAASRRSPRHAAWRANASSAACHQRVGVDQHHLRVGRVVRHQRAAAHGARRAVGPDVPAPCDRARPRCVRGRHRRGAGSRARRRVQSTMVDSTPTRHGPPSSTTSTSSPRSARTSAGGGRAHLAEPVGRRRGHARRRSARRQREGHGLVGHAEADGLESARDLVGHVRSAAHDDGERTGPAACAARAAAAGGTSTPPTPRAPRRPRGARSPGGRRDGPSP